MNILKVVFSCTWHEIFRNVQLRFDSRVPKFFHGLKLDDIHCKVTFNLCNIYKFKHQGVKLYHSTVNSLKCLEG